MGKASELTDRDYQTLAAFRHALRQFLHFSEEAAQGAGLSPQQHQALLSIRAAGSKGRTVGELAVLLMLRPHSATELVDRLSKLELVTRGQDPEDRRRVILNLTPEGSKILQSLSKIHKSELQRLRPLLTELLQKL